MRRGRAEIAVGLSLGAALVASMAYNFLQARRLAEAERQVTADLGALRQLQESLHRRGLQESPVEPEPAAPADAARAALARREANIERLDRQLSEARASIADLQSQLSSANEQREKALASARENSEKEKAELQNEFESMKQQLDSAKEDLQVSRQRISALEANNEKLGSAGQSSSARAAELSRVINDLQDLDRRRETYLTSIMRRYRDITSQFQAMSGMLDSSRDPNPTAFSSAALTRIQNAIALADDDLRQLSELNAQMRQLEKKLPKK